MKNVLYMTILPFSGVEGEPFRRLGTALVAAVQTFAVSFLIPAHMTGRAPERVPNVVVTWPDGTADALKAACAAMTSTPMMIDETPRVLAIRARIKEQGCFTINIDTTEKALRA